jgi:fibronectin-binding autotransporter adhesin
MRITAFRPHPVIVISGYLFSTVCLLAANIDWNVPSGSWGTAANWNPSTAVPGIADLARVNNGGTATIADGATYAVSNLWVGARNVTGATGTVEITSGVLQITGVGTAANRPQVGVGVNAFGRLLVNGGTLERPYPSFMYVGGNGGVGYLTVGSGNAFIDSMRLGSDNSATTTPGTGIMEVSGGLVVVTNQFTLGRDLETGILNITGGTVINEAYNYINGIASDDFMTIAGQNTSTGLVTIASGGTLRAHGGIRIGQTAAAGEVADATIRLEGGKLAVQRLFRGGTSGTSIPRVEFNGGILEAINPTNVNGFIYDALIVRVKAAGVTIDSAGYDLLVTPGILADPVSTGGGITKSNAGTLTVRGTNTYTGPTIVQGGGLALSTASSGGGAVTVNDGCGFGAAVAYKGSSLLMSSLTLNPGAGTNDLNFALGVLGNPTAPVMTAASLAVNRTNVVNVSGAGLSVGQFTLLQFGTGTGVTADRFVVGEVPPGVVLDALNPIVIEPNAVKLNIAQAPSLHWNGNLGSDWDISTLNWLDFSTPTPTAALYYDGAAVLFDDAASSKTVNLTLTLSPASVTVSNNSGAYTFGGLGSISGATGLKKQGAATLILANATNDYSGDTIISAGTLQLGANDVIPQGSTRGNVILEGVLDLNGWTDTINLLSGSGVVENTSPNPATLTVTCSGVATTFAGTLTNSGGPLTLGKAGNNILVLTGTNTHSGGTTINNGTVQAGNDYVFGTGTLTLDGSGNNPVVTSDGTAARSFTNAVVITISSTIGNSLNSGFITLSGPVDFSAGLRNVTMASDTLFSGGSANGAFNKLGTGTLTLQGAHNWSANDVEVRNGTLILDRTGATNATHGIRPSSDIANGTARLVIGPGSFYVLSGNSVNLRVGATGGNTTATNVADIAGTVLLPNANSGSGRIIIGQGTTIGFVNLLTNGLAVVRGVSPANAAGYCEFNFKGGTLQAMNDNPTFMQGISNVFVMPGGAFINSAGFNIAIAQNLLDGGGGLTKLGAGALFLNGVNNYSGTTLVNTGGLGGSGVIAGPVVVTSGGALVPGNSVGTLTINNTLTVQGAAVMEINRDGGVPLSDTAVASTLNWAGTLFITNSGVAHLHSGDSFNLFDWTTKTGTLSPAALPALLPGLSWDTSALDVDGSISITGTAQQPRLGVPAIAGGNLTINGTGGVADGTYYVLTSTDLSLPLTGWTALSTNLFDASGNFSFTDVVNTAEPQRFYVITIP